MRILARRPPRAVLAARLPRLARLLGLGALVLGAFASWAPGTAMAATSPCTVTYSIVNSWPGGFQVGINYTNTGAPLTSWTLAYTFPEDQQVSGGWSGAFSQNAQNVAIGNLSYNGSLGTGQSVSIGFTGTVGGANDVPTYFTVNGFACNGAQQVPSVAVTSPSSGSSATPGSSVALSASASEPTASISKVEFFATSLLPGTSQTPLLIGTATASPYTVTWASAPAGYYQVTAEAFDSAGQTATSAPSQLTVIPDTNAAPQLQVQGNKLVNAAGKQVVLHGVNRSGGEYSCVQGNGLWDGPMNQASITAMKVWGVTAVRVPLNEACWNAESYVNASFAGATYQQAVQQYVNLLNRNGIVAILDLHWTDGAYTGPSTLCASAQATCQKPMPDAAQAIPFWTSVASTFKGNNAVIFDLFNEPWASRATGSTTSGWQCWLNGGASCPGISYTVAGMQGMVNAVRSTGATNVILLGGEEFSNDLGQILSFLPTDPSHDLAVSWHSYNFNTCSTMTCWTSTVSPVAAQVPVIAGEIGENDCADTYISPLMSFLDSINSSYLGWTWNADFDCARGPGLISSYNGTPTAFGAGYRSHLQSLATSG
jgi:endoglucanase